MTTTNAQATMLAVVQDRYGSPDVLRYEAAPRPHCGDGQVLLRVQAASINPYDWHLLRATPFFVRPVAGMRRPKQRVRGVDVAGVIEAVGPGVSELHVGDEVFGFALGSLAERAIANAQELAVRPARLTAAEAASMPMAATTALQGLRRFGGVQPGERVLVVGAAGGVGTFAVQLAKEFGAQVTGVCRTGNVDLVRSLGADEVIDYTTTDFARSGERYDLVFALAGGYPLARYRRVLAPRGRLVLSDGTGRTAGMVNVTKAVVLNPFVRQRLGTFVATQRAEDLVELATLVEQGALTPVVDRTYPLRDAADAIRYLEQGHARGKVVLVPDQEVVA